jgi:alkylation response protein AidB-like acyl-CoA dehydrogenase
MQFVIEELAGLAEIQALPGFEDATPDMVEAVLEGAAQLAGEVISPTNWPGDQQGTRVEDRAVVVPESFHDAYGQFVEGGWPGLSISPEFGGQGLPSLLGIAVEEMWQSANLAFSLCPLLTVGAVRAIESHASDELKQRYLPAMTAGRWAGTMCLTEPQAGSDLSLVRCQAVPEGGHYRISGQKIYITWGDHSLTENIVQLVLARLPDAPPGVRGISLFLVPKFLPDENGNPGERNGVYPESVEHKLGIHASPTCVMAFEDAIGYLVGEEHKGLAHMFTMMNHARLSVGLEGVAVSQRACQQAAQYARERVQGSAPGSEGSVTIVRHPDVRRMLMTMRAQVEAGRALVYTTCALMDLAHGCEDDDERERLNKRVDLLIPVVKGWPTEMAQEVTSLGIQVHGGMGYVEETGAAQFYRDARITTIYEGTSGIQALDLVKRKILRDDGVAMRDWITDLRGVLGQFDGAAGETLAVIAAALGRGVDALEEAVGWLLDGHEADPDLAGAVAFELMMLAGFVAGGEQMARAALVAQRRLDEGASNPAFYRAKLVTARFYAEHLLGRSQACLASIKAGSGSILGLDAEQF